MTSALFVGREAELQRLHDAFDDALAGRGGVVLIAGAPGIGKTRLAREIEAYARFLALDAGPARTGAAR
jgi:predicted ATPase